MKKILFLLISLSGLLFMSCNKDNSGSGESKQLELAVSKITSSDFTVDVKTNGFSGNYFISLVTKADYEKYNNADSVAKYLLEIHKKNVNIDWARADGNYVRSGDTKIKASDVWNLQPKKEYVLVAFGVNEVPQVILKPVTLEVKTASVEPSSNRFEVQVTERGVVTVTTTNDDVYFLDCVEASRVEGYPTDKLAEHIIGVYGKNIGYSLTKGNITQDFERLLTDDTDYFVIVFGYNSGFATTDIVMYPFHYKDPGAQHLDVKFTSEVTNIQEKSAKVVVTPSDMNINFITNVHNKKLVDSYLEGEGLVKLVNDELQILAEHIGKSNNVTITKEQAALAVAGKGVNTYEYTSLDPGTEYQVFAVGFDSKGRICTDVYLSEPFTTKEIDIHNLPPFKATITVNGIVDDGLSISVTPEDKNVSYVVAAAEKAMWDDLNDDALFLSDDVATWKDFAAGDNMTAVELLTSMGLYVKGDSQVVFPETFKEGEYLAYAYGLNSEGVPTTGLIKVFFSVDADSNITVSSPTASALRKNRKALNLRKDVLRRF